MQPSDSRKAAEHAYITTAFNYAEHPVGSRDWSLFWRGWQAYEQTGLHEPSDVVGDLSTTVMRLARELKRVDPSNEFADKALDYLKRKKLTSPLRALQIAGENDADR